jgi:glutaredoxin 3
MSGAATKEMILAKNKENPVMVYSATYCPYCSEVKSLFQNLKVDAKVIEVNNLEDGDAVRAGLTEITGSRTVPQVFIGGKHVGGCDDTVAAYKSGELKTMLASAGISI